jgi:hypothetical protein
MRRLLAALVILAWPAMFAAPAGATTEGPCSATFNGVATDLIDDLGSPLELDAGATLVFAGSIEGGTTAARVALVAGPVDVDSASTAYATPSNDFSAAIELDGLTPYAVGLYRIRGTADGCTVEAWLRITGRFPLATLAGLTGAGLALAGVAGQLGAIASRRRWTGVGAALAGVLTGSGAAVVAQQFGRLQPSYPALGGCVAAAALVGFGLARTVGTGARERRRRTRRDRAAGAAVSPAPQPVTPAATIPARVRSQVPVETQPQPGAEPPQPASLPYWGYVLSEVEVFDLADHTRVVGALRPGTWYLIKREVGPWVHIAATPGPEGWAARHAINRQG